MPTCQAVIRNLVYKFMNRLEKSEISIIQGLVRLENSDAEVAPLGNFVLF